MKTKTQYKVVTSTTDEKYLSVAVEQLLSEGWQLHGGVSISLQHRVTLYAQALIKHEIVEEPINNDNEHSQNLSTAVQRISIRSLLHEVSDNITDITVAAQLKLTVPVLLLLKSNKLKVNQYDSAPYYAIKNEAGHMLFGINEVKVGMQWVALCSNDIGIEIYDNLISMLNANMMTLYANEEIDDFEKVNDVQTVLSLLDKVSNITDYNTAKLLNLSADVLAILNECNFVVNEYGAIPPYYAIKDSAGYTLFAVFNSITEPKWQPWCHSSKNATILEILSKMLKAANITVSK